MNSVSVIVVYWVHDTCRQTPRPPQAARSNINKCTADQQWSYASVHPSNTHTCTNWNSLKERERKYSVIQKKKDLFWLLFIWCPAGLGPKGWQGFTVPKLCFCHYQDRKTKQENRPPSFPSSSIPHWRFPSTFLVHYRNVCWDYVRNTCFLLFWSDQGHFSLLFLLCYQLSKHQTTVWSAFVQTADITCCQRASRSRSCKL